MDLKEAFAVIAGVCVNHNTTLEGHQKIQNALQRIREKLFPEPKKPQDTESGENTE